MLRPLTLGATFLVYYLRAPTLTLWVKLHVNMQVWLVLMKVLSLVSVCLAVVLMVRGGTPTKLAVRCTRTCVNDDLCDSCVLVLMSCATLAVRFSIVGCLAVGLWNGIPAARN